MTYQRDPYVHRKNDYIDQSAVGWAPIILGVAFVCLLAFLIFGPAPQANRDALSQRSTLPNTAPHVPSVPTPAPKTPQ
jgi:hypothetical protein